MTDNRRSEPSSNVSTLADAQARFSEVIDQAQTHPQVITRHGQPSAVLVSAEEWASRTARKGTLADSCWLRLYGRTRWISNESVIDRVTSNCERPAHD